MQYRRSREIDSVFFYVKFYTVSNIDNDMKKWYNNDMKSSVYSMCAIFAGVLWGIISVFLKGLYAVGFSALQVMFLRAFISCLFMGFFLFFKDKSLLKFDLKDIWMFLGSGVVSLSFFSLCYFYTILVSGASVAVILLYTSPIFVLLLSVFKNKKRSC